MPNRLDMISRFASLPEHRIGLISNRDFSSDPVESVLDIEDEKVILDMFYRYLSDRFFLFYSFGASNGRFYHSPMFTAKFVYPYVRYSGVSRPPLESYLTAYFLSLPFLRSDNIVSSFNTSSPEIYGIIDGLMEPLDMDPCAILSPHLYYPFVPDPEVAGLIAGEFFDVFGDMSTFDFGSDFGIEPVVYRNGVPYLNRERQGMTPAQRALVLLVRRALDRFLIFNYNSFGPFYLGKDYLMLPSTPTLFYYLARRNEFLDMFEQALLVPYTGEVYPQYRGKKTYLEVLYIHARDLLYMLDLSILDTFKELDEGSPEVRESLGRLSGLAGSRIMSRREEIESMPVFQEWVERRGPNPGNMIALTHILQKGMLGVRGLARYYSRFYHDTLSGIDLKFKGYGYYRGHYHIDRMGYMRDGEFEEAGSGKPEVYLAQKAEIEGYYLVDYPGIIIFFMLATEGGLGLNGEKFYFSSDEEYIHSMLNRAWHDMLQDVPTALMFLSPVLDLYTYSVSFFGPYDRRRSELDGRRLKEANVPTVDWLEADVDFDGMVKKASEYRKNPQIFRAQARQLSQEILRVLYSLGNDTIGINLSRGWADELVLFYDLTDLKVDTMENIWVSPL
jgi:hypothetical protein